MPLEMDFFPVQDFQVYFIKKTGWIRNKNSAFKKYQLMNEKSNLFPIDTKIQKDCGHDVWLFHSLSPPAPPPPSLLTSPARWGPLAHWGPIGLLVKKQMNQLKVC